MLKSPYRAIIVYQRERLVRYTNAVSDKQAKVFIINRLAKEQGIDPRIIAGYFRERPDAINISIETEMREIDDEKHVVENP